MPQNVNVINQGIQSVEELYRDKGYILAQVEDIKEDPPGTIQLTVNEGRVHSISFSGNRKTKDYVIRRAMALKEGDIYSEKVITEDMRRIFSTQSFSDVRRSIRASAEAPGEYDLIVEVDEKKTGAISLGGGVDTATGVFGSVGYSDPNFLGRGQNVSTVFSLGSGVLGSTGATIHRSVLQAQANWFNPSIADTPNSLNVSAFARELASFNVPLAVERRLGGGVTWGRVRASGPGSRMSGGVAVENIHLREGVSQNRLDDFDISPAQREAQLEDGSYVYLTPQYNFDSRNNRFNPNQGWLTTIGGRAAAGFGIDSYGTVNANIRRYLKVTDNVTFAMNVQGGSTVVGAIPAFHMVRLGGAYTIRGFQEGGLGVGGDYVLGSVELRTKLPFLRNFAKLPLYDIVQAALFADAGTLFDEADTNNLFGRPGYGISAGVGVRVNLPSMGPIRIDWANPLGGDTGKYTRRFNFGVGQKF